MGLTVNEFKIWLGINYVMSALEYPVIRMYWAKEWRVPIISNSMTRDRFFAIRSNLKCTFDPDVSIQEKEVNRFLENSTSFSKNLEWLSQTSERVPHFCR